MTQISKWETGASVLIYLSALTPMVFLRAQYFPFVAPRAFYLVAVSELAVVAACWVIAFKRQALPKINRILVALAVFVFAQVIAGAFGGDWLSSFWSFLA